MKRESAMERASNAYRDLYLARAMSRPNDEIRALEHELEKARKAEHRAWLCEERKRREIGEKRER